MGTQTSYSDALRALALPKVLKKDFMGMDYFLKNCESVEDWENDSIEVRFKGNTASSVKLGSLTAQAEINKSRVIKGTISTQPEAWGSLIFNEKDLMRHGKFSEQNFLKLLPDELDEMLKLMKRNVSLSFTNGPRLATATGNGSVSDGIVVDRIERFEVGMPVVIDDSNSDPLRLWVKTIDMNSDTLVCSTNVALSDTADLSAYTTAQTAVFYLDGGETSANRFTSLKDVFLTSGNGGSSSIYGVTKTAWPYLQAINRTGAAYTSTNIHEKLLDDLAVIQRKAGQRDHRVCVSNTHWVSVLKNLETAKGAYRRSDEKKADLFSWREVEIMGPQGSGTLVNIPEMDDNFILVCDLKSMKIRSHGWFRQIEDPDGNMYYKIRDTDGYKYVTDFAFFGDLVVEKPANNAVIHSISY